MHFVFKRKRKLDIESVLIIVLLYVVCTMATTKPSLGFSSLFQGGAVLQRGVAVSVWGNSSDKTVNISIGNKKVATAVVNSDGSWNTYLPKQSASFNRKLTVKDSTGTVTVLVSFGDVLLCSGQSNMQMPVGPNNRTGFNGANGTAESAAAGRYTGKIWLASAQRHAGWNNSGPSLLVWNAVTPNTLPGFSAVCWYAGKSHYEYFGGKVPVGLMVGAVGGSPIEFWLPKESIEICEIDDPPCDDKNNKTDSQFFNQFIKPLQPYTIGTVIWDQGERDVHCFPPVLNRTGSYPCMEKQLIHNWQKGFNSSFIFIAVQLPGYIGDCDPDFSDYKSCVPGVFDMRLAQDKGVSVDKKSFIVPTYDQSCPYGVKTSVCPFGSVHPLNKTIVGSRIALHLRDNVVADGPRVQQITTVNEFNGNFSVIVTFSGDSKPFKLEGTTNCDECCTVSDFDVSADGKVWINGTVAQMISSSAIRFSVALSEEPLIVRYTANRAFPQCAVYNQQLLPAFPFEMNIKHFGI